MYCSCGVAVAQALAYCNYCGAKLAGAKDDDGSATPLVRPELLVSAMAGVFILGLVAITVLMGVMKSVLNLEVGQVLGFALFPFAIMLLLEVVFYRLLFRSKRGASKAAGNVLSKGHETKELDSAPARGLPEHMPSVTEHTTRAFDQSYTERTSK